MAGLHRCLDCARLTRGSRCPEHERVKRTRERRFQTGATSYSSPGWIRLRNQVRMEEPLCTLKYDGCTLVTEEIDHVVPHRGDRALFLSRTNVQGACKRCHSQKTAREALQGGVWE
jgi:5-methylcytosine-specific restriction protein A